MKEHEIIIGVLRDLGRRLRIARAIREAAFGFCVVLFCLVCYQLIEPALVSGLPSAGTAIRISLLAIFAAVAVEVVARGARRVSIGQAAAAADARAHLKDELKSAHWFMSDRPTSPFAELQVQRAAATAAGLDLAVLAPRALPGNALLAGGLGLVLAVLVWMTPQLSRSWDSGLEAGPAEHRDSADLRSLLKDAPHEAEIVKLDLALRKLQQAGGSAEERMRALADARDAIDQANMEASAAREGLAKLVESLKADPKYASVAQAIDEGRMEEAKALLRKLKGDPAAGAREEQAIEPADKGGAPEHSIGLAPESAERDLIGKSAAVNQDAINRVINALDQANERIEVQNRVNNVKRRMEGNLTATNQRGQLTVSQFDNRTSAPNPTPSPETGHANLRGGTLFRQAAVAREEGDTAREGSQTGDASGDSAALPLEGAATRRLDAQLKLETIVQKYDGAEEPNDKGDQGWFYAASREQKSMLKVENVRSRAGYDREDATNHDRVPMRQKDIVKNYFLNLHESEKK